MHACFVLLTTLCKVALASPGALCPSCPLFNVPVCICALMSIFFSQVYEISFYHLTVKLCCNILFNRYGLHEAAARLCCSLRDQHLQH